MTTKKGNPLMQRWMLLCAILLAGFALCGCSTGSGADPGLAEAAGSAPPSGASVQADEDHATGIRSTELLKIGDTLTIVYNDLPTLTPPFEGQIKADGTITLILNKTFQAAGQTRSELEKEIRDAYVPSYFKHMTVTIKVREETRLIYVGGQVRAPGRQAYVPGLTVVKAIQAAGDFTEWANRRSVRLTRAEGKRIIIINATKVINGSVPDIEIYPGDSIYVKKKLF